MLRANKDYTVIGVWSDDLAVYLKPLGGKAVCHGRFPAHHVTGDAPDADYPLALVSYGPATVKNLRVAQVDDFIELPPPQPDQSTVRGRRSERSPARSEQPPDKPAVEDDKKKEKEPEKKKPEEPTRRKPRRPRRPRRP
jgi:hypothetical protein